MVWSLSIGSILIASCKKLVTIPEPVSSITTAEVFSSDEQATSAIAGVYTQMINSGSNPIYSNGAMSLYLALSADEMTDFYGPADNGYFDSNGLQANANPTDRLFWSPAYASIYGANAIIQGLAASTGVHDSVKNELTGEAKFIRAFCYFYLTNIFGNVPLVLTTDFHQTALLPRSPQTNVYQQIEQDLKDAQNALPGDYSVAISGRDRPNKWAATALLARVYLFLGDWADAEGQATTIISNSLYNLENNLNNVFNGNSVEAIWQLLPNNEKYPYNATLDGIDFIPSTGNPPNYDITSSLLHSFEINDQRRAIWIDSTNYLGTTYYFPYKYTVSVDLTQDGAPVSQPYMMLRLAEQFLIRSEAREQQGEGGATDDLNKIRLRAGLNTYAGATDKTSVLTAILHERQVELFAEWGHRWLDLKRTGEANAVLSQIPLKRPWSSNALLYPIPTNEITVDPNLTQNPGY